ncbi:MAG: GNAT family N-acetyltransferase [Rubrobacteraceae bacterium]
MAKATVKTLEEARSEYKDPEQGVGDLRITAYPGHPGVFEVEFHQSVYRWFKAHELADQSYRWVAVTGEGEVVGHLAALPQYYRINGQRVIGHTPADFMVHPKHGIQALILMRNFFRTCENMVACDMVPAAIEVETRLGAEIVGPLDYAVKLLNVSKVPAPRLPARLSRLLNREEPAASPAVPYGYPGYQGGSEGAEDPSDPQAEPDGPAVLPVRPRAPIPAPLQKLLNGGLRAADEALGGAFARGPKARELHEFDESFDELFESVAASVPCTAERDAAFLNWRYGPGSPQHPVTVLGVKEGASLLGYAVLKTDAAGPDGYILDLTARPGRHDVARALVRESVRSLRRAGAPIIRYRHVPSPVSPRRADLQRLGFFFRKSRRNNLLAKFSDSGMQQSARHLYNWSYTVGDGEPTFWLI